MQTVKPLIAALLSLLCADYQKNSSSWITAKSYSPGTPGNKEEKPLQWCFSGGSCFKSFWFRCQSCLPLTSKQVQTQARVPFLSSRLARNCAAYQTATRMASRETQLCPNTHISSFQCLLSVHKQLHPGDKLLGTGPPTLARQRRRTNPWVDGLLYVLGASVSLSVRVAVSWGYKPTNSHKTLQSAQDTGTLFPGTRTQRHATTSTYRKQTNNEKEKRKWKDK